MSYAYNPEKSTFQDNAAMPLQPMYNPPPYPSASLHPTAPPLPGPEDEGRLTPIGWVVPPVDPSSNDTAFPDVPPPSFEEACGVPDNKPPPSFDSVVEPTQQQTGGEMKDDLCTSCVAWALVIAVIVLIVGVAIGGPVGMMAVGAIHLNNCPAQPMIPIYLIVAGALILLYSLNLASGFGSSKKEEPAPAAVAQNADQEAAANNENAEKPKKKRSPCKAFYNFICIVWCALGMYWVFSIYKPSFERRVEAKYCHQVVYMTTFWINIPLIVTLGVLGGVMCCAGFM